MSMLRALLAILALHRLALGIAAALLVVYTLAGFFWVPHLLRTNAQSYVADELGRTPASARCPSIRSPSVLACAMLPCPRRPAM